jgi:hypothetical protein
MSVWSVKKKEETQNSGIHTLTHTHTEVFSLNRMDGAEARRLRIQKILQRVQGLLHQNGESVPLTGTIAILEYETGLTKEKINEILTIGQNIGQLVVDEKNDCIKKLTQKDETGNSAKPE